MICWSSIAQTSSLGNLRNASVERVAYSFSCHFFTSILIILFSRFQSVFVWADFHLLIQYDVISPPEGFPFKNIAQQECVCRAIKKHSRSIAKWKYFYFSTSTKRTSAIYFNEFLQSFADTRPGKVAIAAEKRQTKVAEESFVSLAL